MCLLGGGGLVGFGAAVAVMREVRHQRGVLGGSGRHDRLWGVEETEGIETDEADAPDEQPVSLRDRRTVSLEDLRRELAEDPLAEEEVVAAAERGMENLLANLNWVNRVKPVDYSGLGMMTNYKRLMKTIEVPSALDWVLEASQAFRSVENSAVQQVLRSLDTRIGVESVIKSLDIGSRFDVGVSQLAVRSMDWDAISGASRVANLSAVSGFDANVTKAFNAVAASALAGLDLSATSGLDGIFGRISGLYDPARFKDFFARFRPRNLRAGDVDIEVVERVMVEEGIPFCLVPDEGTVGLLVEAEDAAARRRVLVERSEPVFSACDRVIGLCVDPGLPEQGSLLRESMRAYQDGHHAAAQALATVVLDQLVARHKHAASIKSAAEGVSFIEDKLDGRDWFFMLPVPVAHTKTHLIADPEAFNRHATVHKSSSQQLTPSNAVHAVMLATSFLGYHQGLW